MGQPGKPKKLANTAGTKASRLLSEGSGQGGKVASVAGSALTAGRGKAGPKSARVIKEVSTAQREALKRLADR